MNKHLSEKRDELAEKRSLRQGSTGDENLNKAISRYLKIGFEDGFDACAEIMLADIMELREAIKKQSIWAQKAIESVTAKLDAKYPRSE